MKTRLFLACAAFLCASSLPPVSAHQDIHYAYDAAGRLVLVEYGGGRFIRYVYDADGSLTRTYAIGMTDTDGDGMDDTWEVHFFGGLIRTGEDDRDGDGQSDLAEFLARTDPADGRSVLRAGKPVRTGDGSSLALSWQSVPGVRYLVETSTSLGPGTWTPVTTLRADAAETSAVVGLDASPRRFFRIRVQSP